MPFVQRYSNVEKGGIVFTGNTLGLSKAPNQLEPGTDGSIGAFISLDTSLQVGSFPAGTTLDYTKNGSRAVLELPAGSSVLYAELIWGGLYRSSANDISAIINNSVTFTTPTGAHTVAPDAATAQDFLIPTQNITLGFYVRSANVTSLVQSALGGTYSVQGVPALIEALDFRTADTNHAGWTLAVVYENNTLPLRNLTLWSGGTVVSPEAGSTTVDISDFLTPETPPITGKIFVSTQEGDAVLTGDKMLFGKDVGSLTPLSGANNPQNNFFASQINDENGDLDTSGTFGTRNADAAAGTNTIACRQGWDITAIDVSDKLTTDQTSAVIRFTSDGDLYVPNALGLQIDSNGANLVVKKSANKQFATVGEDILYTLSIKNEGAVKALNATITDLLPPDTTLVAGSITVGGAPYAGSLPVTIAEIGAGETVEVTFRVTVNALPAENPIVNVAHVEYEFYPFEGYLVTTSSDSNPVEVCIVAETVTLEKSVDKTTATEGDTLTYTSVFTNTGNVPVKDVFFTDPIPDGTTFVTGSVYIDGVQFAAYDPANGFALKDLEPQESVTVVFQVRINTASEGCVAATVSNQSHVTFKFVLPNETTVDGSAESNAVQTTVNKKTEPTETRFFLQVTAERCCRGNCCNRCNTCNSCDNACHSCSSCNTCNDRALFELLLSAFRCGF